MRENVASTASIVSVALAAGGGSSVRKRRPADADLPLGERTGEP